MRDYIKPTELFFAVLSLFISFISVIVFILSSIYPERYMSYINISSLFLAVEAFAVGMELMLMKNKTLIVSCTVSIITLCFLIVWLFPSLESYFDLLPSWISIAVLAVFIPVSIISIVKHIKSKETE